MNVKLTQLNAVYNLGGAFEGRSQKLLHLSGGVFVRFR